MCLGCSQVLNTFEKDTRHVLQDEALQRALGCSVARVDLDEAITVYLKTMVTESQWQAVSTLVNATMPGNTRFSGGILPCVTTMLQRCEDMYLSAIASGCRCTHDGVVANP